MSFTTPIRQRTASENEVLRDRFGRSATTSGAPRSASNLSNMSSSSKQMYTTEFIKALFGDSGVVLGDFSCSYQRQLGRLYVSTNAVFFYSNLFGFEKKLKIEHRHALEIDLVRTTSLFIRTSDEEFIFRSFEDRQSVLELIRSCSSTQTISSPPTELSSDVQSNIQMVNNNDELMSSSEHDDEAQQNRNSCQDNSPEDILVPNSLDGAMLWEQMKKHSSTGEWDSLVTMEKLPCKLTEFFDNCLRDSAPRSLSYFQSKVMGDSNVVLGAWAKNTATEGEANAADSLSRTIEFEHTTRWAVAKVKRRQTYQMCGKHAIIQNFTYLQGIPQADAFFVEDMWLLESGSDDDILLNVKFRIVFNKQTMLKSVITNRTKSEASEWFDKYLPFVRSQKLDQKPAQVKTEAPVQKNQLLQSLLTFVLGLSRELPVFSLLVIALALYTYRLKRRVLLLEEIIHDIEMKVIQLADRISVEEL